MKRYLFSALLLFALAPLLLSSGCQRPEPQVTVGATVVPLRAPPTPFVTPFLADAMGGAVGAPPPTPEIQAPPAAELPAYQGTPTPDPPHSAGDSMQNVLSHTVAAGETLANIAQRYGSTVEELMNINDLASGDLLYAGQELVVPGGATVVGPAFKIIPDSELVYGPAARDFNVRSFVETHDGYLLQHHEEVEGQVLAGPEIVRLVADRFSINPRLLLAALEYRSGWLTQAEPGEREYPMGKRDPRYSGLHKQLRWAADQLNWGYYGRAEGGVRNVVVGGETRVSFAPEVNDGTTGVQYWLAAHDGATYESWLQEASPSGFFATYSELFGNPFAHTVDPLWPADLQQPELALPWASGETWYFTGGPHGGWGSGSGWAALDFVPHHEQLGCYPSDAWVLAMAPGVVTRSDFGAVVVDMDGDGYAGTGWAITYMHLESRDRIAVGATVERGDRLGHPSCEGGFSNGTHVHIARTYNGRWVSADGSIPFTMGGWQSQGLGREYDGRLVRGDTVKEACECRGEGNAITAD
ncbi:MAG: LysM peptidoglycan-binding domain-containing protein [Chloroflexota bacterium]